MRRLRLWSALLTGVFAVIVVVPRPQNALWVTLFLTSAALAPCLRWCATSPSVPASETGQGRVMDRALRVEAGAFWRGAGGLAVMVKLSLIVPGGIAIAAAVWFAADSPATRHVIDDR